MNSKFIVKKTYTDTVIPNDSHHPVNIKMSAFHSFIYRLLHIPLSQQNFENELNIIKTIAINNGYPVSMIDQILKHHNKNLVRKLIFNVGNIREANTFVYKRLPFIGNTSYKIKNILRTENIKTAFYNPYTLKNTLVNNKLIKKDIFQNSGVYEISCSDCVATYIGQTGRNFNLRFKEHYKALINKKSNSNVAKHCLEMNYNIDIKNLKIKHICKKGLKMDFLESLEIQKALNECKLLMNDQTDLYKSPLISPL